jgi:hypothetical protein
VVRLLGRVGECEGDPADRGELHELPDGSGLARASLKGEERTRADIDRVNR